MAVQTLAQSIERFASVTCAYPDQDLEREWNWGDYEEGVRFAFFRTYEELRELAARLGTERGAAGEPATTAQRILAQHQAAFRDLQAVLLGVSETQANQPPAEEEWPLRNVLSHIIQTERTFFAINLDALERERTGDGRPLEMSDEAWEAFWAGDPFTQLRENGSFLDLLNYYEELHERVLREFAGISDGELRIPCIFWESSPMPVEFRLHRFDSHLRQHTIQAEKTLDMLGLRPNEARRLLRLVYAALAEVEGARIGAEEIGAEGLQALAGQIIGRTDEVAAAVAS